MTDKPKRRAGNNQGSIYRRKSDGRWVGSVSLGMVDGKRQRKTVYGNTQTEVRKKITALLSMMDRGVPVRTSSPTVSQFLDQWLEGVRKQGKRPRTLQSYEMVVENHLKPALGKYRIERLTQHHVQHMLDDMVDRGLSLRTVQYYRGVLRAALTRAMKQDLVMRNVATLVDLAPAMDVDHVILTPDGARQLFQAARGHRLEALYVVAVTLGVRQGESLGLQWQDVDLETGTMTIRQQLQEIDGAVVFGPPKSRSGQRVIPIPVPVIDVLKEHRRRQLEDRLAAGGRWQTQWELVFCDEVGSPLRTAKLRQQFHELLDTAGLPQMRWHDLRHSTASILGSWGVHPKVAQAILGHADAMLTLKTYTHADTQAVRDASDKMASLFEDERIGS